MPTPLDIYTTGNTAGRLLVGGTTVLGPFTVGAIPVATSSAELGDSVISQSSGTVTIAGLTTLSSGVYLTGIPSTDPHVVGALWNNANVCTISTG